MILSVPVGPADLPHRSATLLPDGIAFFDLGRLLLLAVRPRAALAAENLFRREQLALFQERKVKPHRADNATRWLMAPLSQLFDWRSATHSGIIKALNVYQLQGGLQLEF